MKEILEFIILSKDKTTETIKNKINAGYSTIPLFEPLAELKNRSLFEHLQRFNKFKGLDLKDLIRAGAINIEEKNQEEHTLLQIYILSEDIQKVRMLLSLGAKLTREDFALSTSEKMRAFFNYRPGSGENSILEFCSNRHNGDYLKKVEALIYDEAHSTEEESSNAESLSSDSLDANEQRELNKFRRDNLKIYNENPEQYLGNNRLCLLAARGVHFSPTYFSREAIEKTKENRYEPHTTYSQSTLFDAGYTADDSVAEDDSEVDKRHGHIIEFIEELKKTEDHREKKIGKHNPPASRNNTRFENLYYRLMQVYINSYSTLFNTGSIRVDFGFDTLNNPLVSGSWIIEKGTLYGSGSRMEWGQRSIRRDPHYRRFTGKPKHPNTGYLDLYVFDAEYVRENGFDRALMCAAGHINLSSLYRHEAEIIFNSMISKNFHERRCILSIPSFDKPYAQNRPYFSNYGIKRLDIYTKFKERICSPREPSEYRATINQIAAKAAVEQAATIKKTMDFRLFKAEKRKAVVFDHGNKLGTEPFKL